MGSTPIAGIIFKLCESNGEDIVMGFENMLLANTPGQYGGSFVILAVFFILMYFLLIRPQKKREKKAREMQETLKTGDKIITIGGIVATVVKPKESSVIISVGADKTRFELMKWAIRTNVTAIGGDIDAADSPNPQPKKDEKKEAEKKAEEVQPKRKPVKMLKKNSDGDSGDGKDTSKN